GRHTVRHVQVGVAAACATKRPDLLSQSSRVTEHIGRAAPASPADAKLTEEVTLKGFSMLMGSLDHEWGGFGRAPKFPQPMILEFVLRCAVRGWDGANDALTLTLDRMLAGGIHDHVGGGFARYSTDERWHVPHFEKMLYDNAQLAGAYLDAAQISGDPEFSRVARETLDYVLRDLSHPEGGFYSAEDADSGTPKVEGAFYV